MKRMRNLCFKPLLILVATSLFTAVSAMAADLQKTYTWKYNVNKDANIVFNNYDCNLVIHTWDKGETEYHLIVDARTKTAEDAATLDSYLMDMKFSNSSGSVELSDNFWENRTTVMGRTTLKLKGGKEISLTDLKLKGELWMPSGCSFGLNSKYSDVTFEDFQGKLNLDLYNDNFFGNNVGGKTIIEDKYSTLEFKNMKTVMANLYNSKFEAGNLGNTQISTKYSKIIAASAEKTILNCYNDKVNITRTGNISFNAKYTDLKTDEAGRIDIDCYEGSVIAGKADDITINSKYADFEFSKAGNISIGSSYNDKLTAGQITSLQISESKYCSFRVEELKNGFTDKDGYNDKVNINKIAGELKGISINGKYLDISFGLPASVSYRFRANITYPDLDIDESKFTVRDKKSDDSHLEYNAVKGTEKEGMPLIEVNGYEIKLKIEAL